jgi:hypothetical protein
LLICILIATDAAQAAVKPCNRRDIGAITGVLNPVLGSIGEEFMNIRKIAAATALAAIIAAPAFAQQGFGGGTPPTPEQRKAAFAAADANKDGKLDQAEFKTSLGERAAQMPAEMLPQIFGRRDTNADGFITEAEYLVPMQGRGGGGGGGAPPAPTN